MEITLHAGRHPRVHCPVRVPWPYRQTPASLMLAGAAVAAQRDGDRLVFIPLPMDAETTVTYVPGGQSLEATEEGVLLEAKEDRIAIRIGQEEFTNYWYRGVPARPYFWPVLAPGGVPVTRAYPMRDVEGEVQDHPHHRSLYVAFGEVNQVDNWSEAPGHGFTVHRSLDELVSGPVFGRFATTSDWTGSDGQTLLTQKAIVTVWKGDRERRLLDVDLRLTAVERDVLFGDTKEGGLLTVRVASDFAVDRNKGGRIENSFGGIDEDETWGRAAHWCDYSGLVGERRYGVAVMDHPDSFRYPTFWHVRDYGLMAANPFGLRAYTAGNEEVKDGRHLLKAGESLRFVYRVLVHHGDASGAGVRHHYLSFVSPPKPIVVTGGGD
jgi:hypothetical protein